MVLLGRLASVKRPPALCRIERLEARTRREDDIARRERREALVPDADREPALVVLEAALVRHAARVALVSIQIAFADALFH